MQIELDTQELLIIIITIITACFSGGAFTGIATLIITRKNNFYMEIFRLLIGAIGGYEGLVVLVSFFNFKDENPNEILKAIIYYHQNFPGFFILGISSIFGAIGASIAIFMMRKVFRWRS